MMTQMSLTPAEKSRWITANKLTLGLGLIASFGLVFVASFQVANLLLYFSSLKPMFKVNVFITIQDRQTKLLWLSFGVFEYKKFTCNVT